VEDLDVDPIQLHRPLPCAARQTRSRKFGMLSQKLTSSAAAVYL